MGKRINTLDTSGLFTGIVGIVGIFGTGTCNCGNFKLPLANNLNIDSIFDSNILLPAPLLKNDDNIDNDAGFGNGSVIGGVGMSLHGSRTPDSPEVPLTDGYAFGVCDIPLVVVGKSVGKTGTVDAGPVGDDMKAEASLLTTTPGALCVGTDGAPGEVTAAAASAVTAIAGDRGPVDGGWAAGVIAAETSLLTETPGVLCMGADDDPGNAMAAAASPVTAIAGDRVPADGGWAAGVIIAETLSLTAIAGGWDGIDDGTTAAETLSVATIPGDRGKVDGAGLATAPVVPVARTDPVAIAPGAPMDNDLLIDTNTFFGIEFTRVGFADNEVMKPVNTPWGKAFSMAGLHDNCVKKSVIKNGGIRHISFGLDDRIFIKVTVFETARAVFKSKWPMLVCGWYPDCKDNELSS